MAERSPVQAVKNHRDSPAAREHSPPHRTHALTRPMPFTHPTRAVFREAGGASEARWSSRASRKRRYSQRMIRGAHHSVLHRQEQPGEKSHAFVHVRQRLSESRFQVHLAWDLSFWVAVTFVVGSTAWIVNGFFLFLPLVDVGSDNFVAAAWSAFAGGTLFEIGSYLMYVEAINTGHEELFGPSLWNVFGKRQSDGADVDSPDSQSDSLTEKGLTGSESGRVPVKFRWIGLGSWRELGFLASFIQMWAATIFWVSTITGIPNVISGLPEDPPTAITDVFYWTPQVIGGCGFIISSLLLMIEVQNKWWLPNMRSMGWHVGFWNLVGAVGFMLCGALGYASLSSSGVNYQSVLSTFWGSWAFLIGSVIQLWETLWREDPDDSDKDP